MNLETFFEKFDLFADCPNAVQKMRELILELAFDGKVIPMKSEWPRVVLKSVATKIGSGSTPSGGRESYFKSGIPFIRSMNVHFCGFEHLGLVFLSDEQAAQLASVAVQENDVLLNITGASIGRCITAPADMVDARVNQHVTIIRTKPELAPEFLVKFLASPKIQWMINDIQVGATRQALTKGMIEQFVIPLPPLAEQKRIVAKVDELMALCYALEAQQKEREANRTALAKASLAAFAETPSPASLELLFHPSNAIDPANLRKSILTLAVQGKLVPQDPEDEGAEQLLNRIVEGNRTDVSKNSRRLGKALPPIINNEVEFVLPSNWTWVRLGEVARLWNGFAFSSHDFVANGIPVVRIGDLQSGVVDLSGCVYVPENVAEGVSQDVWVPKGSLLIAMSGATTGKIAFNRTGRRLLLNQRVGRIDATHLESGFVCFFFETIIQRNLSISSGSAIPNLSSQQINETPFPLPPLAEQKRIVAKVDELMALVSRLEAKEKAAQEKGARLLEAMVAELSGKAVA